MHAPALRLQTRSFFGRNAETERLAIDFIFRLHDAQYGRDSKVEGTSVRTSGYCTSRGDQLRTFEAENHGSWSQSMGS